ncbi:MAG TPA: TIGR03560 family F420-dependent LLM class oxidoreductase [Candidatus Limnocylindrales bacterium]|nr:TIGR03560 family F420-dependent LLM class oxidoreductase [Candidatus Limnocylindrales bacterium]
MPEVEFGLLAWPQQTDWPAYRDITVSAEAAGWDSVWTWDHLLAIMGSWEQPILEGWTTLAGIASVTSRVRVGLMVGANGFRNPGLTAKLATTLDHVSGGRAWLGLGGAWFEREHDAFGIDFGESVGQRLDWLEESVGLIRRLLDGETVTHDGPHYQLQDAVCRPLPVQHRLPILVGGHGPRKTLRTVARHADAWNTSGYLDEVTERVRILDEHCADVSRDPATVRRTISFPMVIRDRADEAGARWAELAAANGIERAGTVPHLFGPPAEIAEIVRPYVTDLGFRTVICRMPAPFDRETVDRIGEVRELLAGA